MQNKQSIVEKQVKQVKHDEALIDESIELTFPASDPPAELHTSPESEKTVHCQDEIEDLLDEAIRLTFPASDPIAVSPHLHAHNPG